MSAFNVSSNSKFFLVFSLASILMLSACSSDDGEDVGEVWDDGGEGDGAMEEMLYKYEVMLSNVSSDMPLSRGVFVLHTADFSLNFEGEVAPKEFEVLAELGSHTKIYSYIDKQDGALELYNVSSDMAPGESITFTMEASASEPLFLSGVQMAAGSNDGLVLLDALALGDAKVMGEGMNFDAGTEENEALLGGFALGQPDPEKTTSENIGAGTPTEPQAAWAQHDQLTDVIMSVEVSSVL